MQITNEEFTQVAATFEIAELEQLVRTHSRRLYNFIRRRVGNPEDVEDIAQDTLVEAIRFRERFHRQSRPETWLFGIAMNLIRSYYKRQRVRQIYDDVETEGFVDEMGRGPAELVETHQMMELVSEAFGRLSQDTQLVVHLVFDEQLTYEEAAARLNIPIGTVRSRISRARDQLKHLHPA